MRTLTSGGILLIAAAVSSQAALAGPEITFYSEPASIVAPTPREAPQTPQTPSGETMFLNVNDVLAVPSFSGSLTVNVDSDLDSREHPMIPLPSSFWVAIVMLCGVAMHAARSQRTSRLF